MRVAVIDPGSGNLASVRRALERVGREEGIGLAIDVTADAEALPAADRIVLPGQGAFAACRRGLDALPGMVEALEARVRGQGVPFLGICVGMQLLAERGLEHGVSFGLGWIHGQVERMDPRGPDGTELPLPQMGWNALAFSLDLDHPLLDGIEPGDHAYFVHSYAFRALDAEDVLATTDYGGPVAAIVGRANYVGTQFHVEKSQAVGLHLLANFLRWEP
jgi:imidazole glycerol-phosphate synthase subunit HisH